ncbi:MFS transporter [Catelliglobosispora koreensis]|uniref:MFS transporter n=1 Tax=Catelliglobosispora koreensis TaxID=129052 RepID=UPI000367C8C6|nr:MFS transporter [Catelliglobosispora koreensis]
MTTTLSIPAATPTVGGGPPRHRVLIAVLAVTQTVGYGVMFYAFSVLLAPIAVDLHASTAAVTGAFTTAVVFAAGASIPVGRWLDRHGGRALMATGSTLAVVAVVLWSRVDSLWQLYAVFAVLGVASASVLYEAAFPVLVATVEPARRNNALLAVTIVAGFASSIFFPLTGLLLEQYGWRTTLLILAGMLAVITVPGHLLVVPGRARHHHTAASRTGMPVREALRDKSFWLLTVAFVVHGAALSAMGVLLIVYLQHAGHTTAIAATLAGLLGILSVTGRLVTTGLSRRFSMQTVTAVVFIVQAVGAAALPFLSGTLAGAAACVTAFGLGFGVATIARPAILAGRYGTARYATIAATMTVPITLAKASAPLGAALLVPDVFITTVALACLLAAALLIAAGRTPASKLDQ